jgi:hypothetical protein
LLDDEKCFPLPDDASQIAIALYDPATLERLPLGSTEAALTIRDNALYLPFSPMPTP